MTKPIKPFALCYGDSAYVVSFSRKQWDNCFINIRDVLSGESFEVCIKDYSDGTGNEHLVGTLEWEACLKYARLTAKEFFGFDIFEDDIMTRPDGIVAGIGNA